MLNKIILMGRLCADPTLKQTQTGISVCRFRIAVERPYRTNGNQGTDFITISSWRQSAEFVSRYFRKGSMIIVEGRLQNADYTDSNGVKHYAMEVQAEHVSFGEARAAATHQSALQTASLSGKPPAAAYGANGNPPQDYQPTTQNAAQSPQHSYAADVGDLSEFETILSNGDDPFLF